MPYKFLSLPHYGIATEKDATGFFDRALKAVIDCRDFILSLNEKKLDQDAIYDMFYKKYATETLLGYQPLDAFIANARATIACTLREFAAGDDSAVQG